MQKPEPMDTHSTNHRQSTQYPQLPNRSNNFNSPKFIAKELFNLSAQDLEYYSECKYNPVPPQTDTYYQDLDSYYVYTEFTDQSHLEWNKPNTADQC